LRDVWGKNNPYEGSDDYGFSALPGGFRDLVFFKGEGEQGWWWEQEIRRGIEGIPSYAAMGNRSNSVGYGYPNGYAMYVRCVQELTDSETGSLDDLSVAMSVDETPAADYSEQDDTPAQGSSTSGSAPTAKKSAWRKSLPEIFPDYRFLLGFHTEPRFQFLSAGSVDYDAGLVWAIGLDLIGELGESFRFGEEFDIYFGNIGGQEGKSGDYGYKITLSETGWTWLTFIRYMLPVSRPVYIETGFQIGSGSTSYKASYKMGTEREVSGEDINDRSMDVGWILGAGYTVTPKLNVCLRWVLNLNSPFDDAGGEFKSSLSSLGFGITYRFLERQWKDGKPLPVTWW